MFSRSFTLLAFAASSLAATQCSNFVPPASKTAELVVTNATTGAWVYAQTKDCPTSCGAHCEAGCLFCADSGVLPGMLPPADLPNTLFIAVSTSAKTDQCASAFDDAGAYKYQSGDLLQINGTGLVACFNKFFEIDHRHVKYLKNWLLKGFARVFSLGLSTTPANQLLENTCNDHYTHNTHNEPVSI
ncbi:MAG: hypothetical protein WCJ17_01445 [bacterium]